MGTHLAAVHLSCGARWSDEPVPWEEVLPQGDGPLVERITTLNARSIGLLDPAGRALLAERGTAFLHGTEGLAPAPSPVQTPGYGPGVTLTLATVTGLMLSGALCTASISPAAPRRPGQSDRTKLVLSSASRRRR